MVEWNQTVASHRSSIWHGCVCMFWCWAILGYFWIESLQKILMQWEAGLTIYHSVIWHKEQCKCFYLFIYFLTLAEDVMMETVVEVSTECGPIEEESFPIPPESEPAAKKKRGGQCVWTGTWGCEVIVKHRLSDFSFGHFALLEYLLVPPQQGWGRHSTAVWNCRDFFNTHTQTRNRWCGFALSNHLKRNNAWSLPSRKSAVFSIWTLFLVWNTIIYSPRKLWSHSESLGCYLDP